MLHASADMRLDTYAANHEFGRAQYEINLRHSDALDASDRAYLFKDLVKEMAAGCDVIITGIGDCGSCSASAVADGIAFEAAGLPAAAICSDAFRVTADAMAELRGAPGYRYASTPHPVAVLSPDQVKQRAAQVLDDVMNLLTEPE